MRRLLPLPGRFPSSTVASARHTYFPGPESLMSLLTSPAGLMALLYRRQGTSGGAQGASASVPGPSAPAATSASGVTGTFNGTAPSPPPQPSESARTSPPPPPTAPAAAAPAAAWWGDTLGKQLRHLPGGGGCGGEEGGGPRAWYKNDAVVLAGLIMAMSAVWEFLQSRRHRVQQLIAEQCYVTLEVRTYQEEFDMILDWLSRQELGQKSRNITFKTFRHDLLDDDDTDRSASRLCDRGEDWIRGVDAFAPGYGLHRAKFRGRTFYISRDVDGETSKGVNASGGRNGENAIAPNEVLTVTVLARNRKIVEEWMQEVRESALREHKKMVPIFVAARYGGWMKLCSKPKRPLTTLYLPDHIRVVIDEVKAFYTMHELYRELGVPWRRGYLLEGPPGTGKSSLIFAIAGALNLPVHILNIRDSRCSDNELLTLINSTPKRCLVVLEDLDTSITKRQWEQARKFGVRAAAERSWFRTVGSDDAGAEGDEDGSAGGDSAVTISGLLNAIDGIAANEGRVLFVTANHPEVFPDALLRPGRIDKRVTFSNMGEAELRQMFAAFAPPGMSPSELLKRVTGNSSFAEAQAASSAAEWQGKLLSFRLAQANADALGT